MKDIKFNPPQDLSEAYDRAEGFIAIEEDMESLKPLSQSSDKPRDFYVNIKRYETLLFYFFNKKIDKLM